MTQTFPLIDALKAAGEPTRMRILVLLRQGELSVGELVDILDQSQPRLSHHLKTLTQAGLVQRFPEGAWVFYRLCRSGPGRNLLEAFFSELEILHTPYEQDQAALQAVRSARAVSAEQHFAEIAESWDRLRGLHYPEDEIEQAMLDAAKDRQYHRMIDLGTGTGRMLTLFSAQTAEAEGLDFSHQMLTIARANLAEAGITHAHVRHGRVEAPPFRDASADLVILHQVLHYLDQPAEAIRQAARLLAPGGQLFIVDFAAHELEFLRETEGHSRLGFRQSDMQEWLQVSGMKINICRSFAPPEALEAGLEVNFWVAEKESQTEAIKG